MAPPRQQAARGGGGRPHGGQIRLEQQQGGQQQGQHGVGRADPHEPALRRRIVFQALLGLGERGGGGQRLGDPLADLAVDDGVAVEPRDHGGRQQHRQAQAGEHRKRPGAGVAADRDGQERQALECGDIDERCAPQLPEHHPVEREQRGRPVPSGQRAACFVEALEGGQVPRRADRTQGGAVQRGHGAFGGASGGGGGCDRVGRWCGHGPDSGTGRPRSGWRPGSGKRGFVAGACGVVSDRRTPPRLPPWWAWRRPSRSCPARLAWDGAVARVPGLSRI